MKIAKPPGTHELTPTDTKRLLVVQPYVPEYRVPLFEQLREKLHDVGIDMTVAAATPIGDQAARRDSNNQEFHWLDRPLPQTSVSIPRLGEFQRYSSWNRWSRYEGIILPFSSKLIDAQVAAVCPRRRRPALAFWGHIENFVTPTSSLDQLIKSRMARRADHIFAYTRRGAERALSYGVPVEATTTLDNTIDTSVLRASLERLTAADVRNFRASIGLRDTDTAYAYIGGMDDAKQIPLFANTLDRLYERSDSTKFIVAGTGSAAKLLRPALGRGQVRMVGYADSRMKALMGRACVAVFNPGRIGLLAVDSLVLGIPIVTSSYDRHGPEFEYLEPGVSLFVGGTNGSELASFIQAFHPRSFSSRAPLMEHMVEQFAIGIQVLMRH